MARIANSRTGHLANYTTRGLDKSRTGQLADAAGDFACLVFVLLAESARPRVVQFATCPVRELAIRELSCYRVCMSAAVEPLWARCSHPCTACPGANIAKSSATGKVTVGLLSHWPCVTDFTGLSTDMLGEEDMFICSVYDFYRASYASAVLAVVVCPSVRLSVCPSVCHKPVLYRNGNT